MPRDEITKISSYEIVKKQYKQKLRKRRSFPAKVIDELNAGTGDYIYYFVLADGTVQIVNQDFIDARKEDYYEQMLPENFVDIY